MSLEFKFITRAVSENEKKNHCKNHIIDRCRVMSLEFKFITRAVSENEKKNTVKIILLIDVE